MGLIWAAQGARPCREGITCTFAVGNGFPVAEYIENEFFVLPQTVMVFGDAKVTLNKMSAALKG